MPSPAPVHAAVCVLGAGPHALATVLSLLAADRSLVGRIVVVDPSGEWLSTWEAQFARLEIDVLRSPSVHHPSPEVDGLTRFTAEHRLPPTGLPYDPPSSAAFLAFTRHLVDDPRVPAPLPARARLIEAVDDGLRIQTSGPVVVADRLVIATNPHHRSIPTWVSPLLAAGDVDLSHARDLDLRRMDALENERVVVVGGGLTAAHLVCGAAARGAVVHLIARAELCVRDFDTSPGWLGPKNLRAYGQLRDPRERLAQARAARGGGSIPPWMHERLREQVRSGAVVIHAAEEVARAEARSGGCRLGLHGGDTVDADRVWLATGTRPDISALRALRPLLPDIATLDGLPMVDEGLRVGLHPVHVTGRLATLELGPAAGNLWGARHGAHRIARAITGVDVDFLAQGSPAAGGQAAAP